MNMIIFKLFRYILLYKKIMITDIETLKNIIQFLHLFALTTLDTPPINNIREIANESICILVNKMMLEEECILDFIKIQVTNAINLLQSSDDNLDIAFSHIVSNTFYLAKGLVIKGDPLGFQFVEKVIEIFP